MKLDDSDMKAVEDAFFRAMVRVLKHVLKGGLLPQKPAVAAPAAPAEVPAPPVVAAEPAPAPVAPAVVVVPPAPEKRRHFPAAQWCEVVGDPPHGYIKIEEARELIGVPPAVLSRWVATREVKAVVATNVTPKSRGCVGHVMVDADSVLKRDALRKENAKHLQHLRRQPKAA